MREEPLLSSEWVHLDGLHVGDKGTLDVVAGGPFQRTKLGDFWIGQSCC